MNRQLFIITIFYLLLPVVSSLRCYGGSDRQCLVLPDLTDCGGSPCRCSKFRFKCMEGDQACTKEEQSKGTAIWVYAPVSSSACEQMKILSPLYMDAECCAKDKCNRPASGKCSWSQSRRRATRRLTDLLDLE